MSNEIKKLAASFQRYLRKEYSDIKTILKFNSQFQLLVSIVLSAQTTDENVNKATKGLFKKYPNAKLLSAAKLRDIESLVFSTGFYKVKSKNIHTLSKVLVSDYNSRIPKTIDELVKLPGVGRKTASVFLAETFDQPTIAVDTHVLRVSHRLGFSSKRYDPIQTEKELKQLFPKNFWRYLSMSFVQFGRDVCNAKKPLCNVCNFNNSCKYFLSVNT
ncbi:MAG: endonuclease III [Candidatus Actinomarina sp.]|jgi:endonuclease-3|nr:MAG: endonuclease III [Acidimicrobiaceae bacterium TMED244]|tara:strand:+ start:4634 stop:5281 length:648 start_codon:yes stop_codon:yes gene_type:complete